MWVDHPEMLINMDESQLRTIEQIEQFLAASAEVAFTAHGSDVERYANQKIKQILGRKVIGSRIQGIDKLSSDATAPRLYLFISISYHVSYCFISIFWSNLVYIVITEIDIKPIHRYKILSFIPIHRHVTYT